MGHENWDRQKVLDRMYAVFRKKRRLSAKAIREHDSSLLSIIYLKYGGENPYFSSLPEARAALAAYLSKTGKYEDAFAIREGNIVYDHAEKQRKKNEKKKAEKRRQVLDELKRKIDGKKPVSREWLEKNDFHFYQELNRWVGYKKAMEILNVNSADFGTPTWFPREHYINQLISFAESGYELDRPSLKAKFPLFVRRISAPDRFGGYYKAMEVAYKFLQRRGNSILTERLNPEMWKRIAKEKRKRQSDERREKIKKEAFSRIFVLRKSTNYSLEQMAALPETAKTDINSSFEGAVLGREIYDFLANSGNWLTTAQAAEILNRDGTGLVYVLPKRYPEKTIRYFFDKDYRSKFLFHVSAVEDYRRKIAGQ